MQILSPVQHRALAFVAATNRGGHRPSEEQVQKWLESPTPLPGVPARYSERNFADLVKAFKYFSATAELRSFRELLLSERVIEHEAVPAESVVTHLKRLDWLSSTDQGELQVTPLGRALLRTAESEDEEVLGPDSVVLGADDELSYPMLIARLAAARDGMVIDPYLRAGNVLTILMHTEIGRVLVSEKLGKKELTEIAVLVESYQRATPFEVRVAAPEVLHDRYIVSDDQVEAIGTSFNTVGKKHMTVLTPLPSIAADTIRAQANQWWVEARSHASCGPAAGPELAASDATESDEGAASPGAEGEDDGAGDGN